MRARFVRIGVRQRENGKQCRDAAPQWAETPTDKDEEANAKDPEAQDGRQA
jgi:hypothetical protein